MIRFDEAGASGEIVGVYTGVALEGVASHPGEKLHLHFVSADGLRSGHVDEVLFAAGTTLLLPVARPKSGTAPSPCSGMETRTTKSLSEAEIAGVRGGTGWGNLRCPPNSTAYAAWHFFGN